MTKKATYTVRCTDCEHEFILTIFGTATHPHQYGCARCQSFGGLTVVAEHLELPFDEPL